MKNQFHVFYEKDEVDFNKLDNSTLIVLDANVLLHFFRYSNASREKLLTALKKIQSNIFVPYQASLEYHFSRQSVERAHNKNVDNLINNIDEAKEKFINTIKESLESYGKNIRSTDEVKIREEVIKELMIQCDKFMDSFKNKTLIKETELITKNEQLSYEISSILTGKVGEKFSAEEIKAIQKEGEERYFKEIPPGFKDESKDNELRIFGEYEYKQKFGDLILWKEIIKYCKEHEEIKRVFLISDDVKDDWLFKTKGEIVGIRVELKQELFEKCGTAIELFSTNKLLNEVLNSQVDIVKDYEVSKTQFSSCFNNLYELQKVQFINKTTRDKEEQEQYEHFSNKFHLKNTYFKKTIFMLNLLKYTRTIESIPDREYHALVEQLMRDFEREYMEVLNNMIINFKFEDYEHTFILSEKKYTDYLNYKKNENINPRKIVRLIRRMVDILLKYSI